MCRSHQDSSRHISYIVRLCPTWPRLQILGEQTACNFLVPDNSSEVHSDAVVSKIERKLSMFGKIFRHCGRPGVAILMSFPSICGRMDWQPGITTGYQPSFHKFSHSFWVIWFMFDSGDSENSSSKSIEICQLCAVPLCLCASLCMDLDGSALAMPTGDTMHKALGAYRWRSVSL